MRPASHINLSKYPENIYTFDRSKKTDQSVKNDIDNIKKGTLTCENLKGLENLTTMYIDLITKHKKTVKENNFLELGNEIIEKAKIFCTQNTDISKINALIHIITFLNNQIDESDTNKLEISSDLGFSNHFNIYKGFELLKNNPMLPDNFKQFLIEAITEYKNSQTRESMFSNPNSKIEDLTLELNIALIKASTDPKSFDSYEAISNYKLMITEIESSQVLDNKKCNSSIYRYIGSDEMYKSSTSFHRICKAFSEICKSFDNEGISTIKQLLIDKEQILKNSSTIKNASTTFY